MELEELTVKTIKKQVFKKRKGELPPKVTSAIWKHHDGNYSVVYNAEIVANVIPKIDIEQAVKILQILYPRKEDIAGVYRLETRIGGRPQKGAEAFEIDPKPLDRPKRFHLTEE